MKAAGIYRITAKTSSGNLFYIGQAVSFQKRFTHHRCMLRAGKHTNPILQRVWDANGADALSFDVVLVCERSAEMLHIYEQAILDFYVQTYGRRQIGNICMAQVSTRLGVKARDETRAKMAARNVGKRHSPETIERIRAAKKGQGPSREHIERLAMLNKGRKMPPHAIARTAAAKRGKPLSPEAIRKRQETRRINAEQRGYWCSPESKEKRRSIKPPKDAH